MFAFLGKIWLPFVMFIVTFLYWHYTKTFDYWRKKGVFYFEPVIFFGNIKDRILFRKAFHQFWLDTYKKMKGHKFVGFYEGRRQTLVVLDPEIIKHVLIRDFSHFMDRPTLQMRYPVLQRQLLNLKGQEWKKVRSMLTPAFSSGKLKAMEILIRQCGKQLKQYLNKVTDNNDGAVLEMKEFYGHFTMDVIATTAFGVQTDSLENPDSEFLKSTSRFNEFTIFERMRLFFVLIFVPQLAKYLPVSFFNLETLKFLENVTKDNIRYRKNKNEGTIIEMKEFYGHYTMDVIASYAFGIKTDSLENPDSKFLNSMKRINALSIFERFMLFLVLLTVPGLAKYLPLSFFNMKAANFLTDVTRKNIKDRQTKNEKRNDFLQLMLDAEEESRANEKSGDGDCSTPSVMDETTIIAQAVLFLVAGFETSSTLLTFASYELALHKEIQDKLRDEIKTKLEQHGEDNMYEAIQDMPYLDMVLNEALRKHPPLARVDRSCTSDYTIPETSVVIEKGINVSIPVLGIHYDPDYYPEPEKFIPERFSPEEKSKRSPYVFLPFGAGPRNCIALRFAMLSTKMAMVYLLKDFEINTCEKTQIPYKYSRFSMLLKAEKGVWLQIKPL